MKGKVAFCITVLFFLTTAIFATDYSFRSHPAINVRNSGFGGAFSTDTSTISTLFSNPAALALSKNQTHYSTLALNLAGPEFDLYTLLQMNLNKKNLSEDGLKKLLEKHGALNFDSSLAGPLFYGNITNGFGWSISNNSYMSVSIPSANVSDVRVGEEFLLQFGYGIPLVKTKNHFLSVGISAKALVQAEFFSNVGIDKLNRPFQEFPFYVNAGFGFNIGTFYQFGNVLGLSMVFHDVYSPMFINALTDNNTSSTHVIPTDLTIGVSLKIPPSLIGKVVTSWLVMADYKNIIHGFAPSARNPLLNLSVGTELQLINMFAFRIGMSDLHIHAGFGFKISTFNMDIAIYKKEFGLEPGTNSQFNMDLSFSFVY
ncbi:MAG: hypothetical protein ACRC4W_03415 [Treponemataceae bacterium]